MKFPNMARGGAAVSTAPLGSGGLPFGSAGGELFAVGFGGGSVALYDARCQAAGGMVAGFVTRHRWLERVRSAGPLLMASYGRCKNAGCGEGQRGSVFCFLYYRGRLVLVVESGALGFGIWHRFSRACS